MELLHASNLLDHGVFWLLLMMSRYRKLATCLAKSDRVFSFMKILGRFFLGFYGPLCQCEFSQFRFTLWASHHILKKVNGMKVENVAIENLLIV